MSWNPIRHILLVDDQKSELQGLINLAENKSIEIEYYPTWEEAKIELAKNFDKYHAIILDGKGQLDSDSATDDARHIHKALGWLREEKGKGNHIHYILYTGYHGDFDALQDEVPIYSKSDNKEEEMLDAIVEATKNYVKIKFPDVFSVFEERLLPCSKTKKNYQFLASKVINNELEDISGLCSRIRRIQESITRHIEDYIIRKKENVSNVKGQGIINLARMTYSNSSSKLHYKLDEKVIHSKTKYNVIAMFYALNEQLLWYKQVIHNL